MKEALYYEKSGSKKVRCRLCPYECTIPPGGKGACGIRQNVDGILYSLIYGKTTGISLDPIEKKPLYHYHPGEEILSLGTRGCNLHCDFCQNWHVSQVVDAPMENITSEEVVKKAKELGSFGIAYTYNEKNVLVTNGFVNKAPLEEMLPYIDAMNIDLKAFDEDFYVKVCKGRLKPVLDTIKISAKACHIELTNLIIPTLNDSEGSVRKMVDWIYDNLGPEVPLHLSRYFPCYKMNLPPTPIETLKRAEKIAKEKLKYVYIGNT
ncbi:MAG: radical SAM protein [Candidatus Omnitrophica bacterium]|nr:radical SAM protein [Candidatus Omnitrophota bacterium]